MKLRDAYWFLQPTIAAALGFAAVVLVRSSLVGIDRSGTTLDAAAQQQLATTLGSLELPSASLTPDEVVHIQLAALSSPNRSDGALQCFCFASPQNRTMTGPLQRFARFVRYPPYDKLSAPAATAVGKATFQDGTARVLVTVANDQEIQAFVWVLSKQTAPPWSQCWMTDAVFPLQSPAARPYASPALPDAS